MRTAVSGHNFIDQITLEMTVSDVSIKVFVVDDEILTVEDVTLHSVRPVIALYSYWQHHVCVNGRL